MIVITGATRFIGSNLAKLFLKKGAEVFVLVLPESTHLDVLPKDEKLHVVPCGLSNVMDCVSYIKEADAFFHLAWGGVNRQEIDSPEVQAKNVAGSLDCIRAAKALNCRMFMDAGAYFPCLNGAESMIYSAFSPRQVVAASVKP